MHVKRRRVKVVQMVSHPTCVLLFFSERICCIQVGNPAAIDLLRQEKERREGENNSKNDD